MLAGDWALFLPMEPKIHNSHWLDYEPFPASRQKDLFVAFNDPIGQLPSAVVDTHRSAFLSDTAGLPVVSTTTMRTMTGDGSDCCSFEHC